MIITITLNRVSSHPNSSISLGNCIGYQIKDNRAIFDCENNIHVQIERIAEGIIKVWYNINKIQEDNKSFAVIKKADTTFFMNVIENSTYYEVHTGNLIVRAYKSPFRLEFYNKYQGLLMEDFKDKGFISDSVSIKSYKVLKPGERIYGLGEKNGSLNRVGEKFKMWNSDRPCYSLTDDPLYKSIPFFMSSSGYGIYFDNTYKTNYNFGLEDNGYYSFSSPGGEMEYYFIYGPTYKQIITRYIELTGHPIMPPAWALGFAQCRGLLTNEQLTRDIARGYRNRKIPCDIIYQDIGWTKYLQNFEWNNDNYNDPVKMLDDLNTAGFKVIVSQDPVISKKNREQWQQADSLGYFVKDVRTGETYDMPWPWGGNCGIVDFTNPKVANWWGNYQQKVVDDGVSGFWTDMGEPAWCNEESTDRLNMRHYLGMHNKIHNVYGLTWDKVVKEQFEKHNPSVRIFQMTRSAFAGMQRYTFGWSGDSGNGNDVTNGWKHLAGQLPLALSAGMCGIPFWTTDISGYCGDITDYNAMSELYIRWLQFGAFNPLSRIHHEGNNAVEPWLFGEDAEQIAKQTIELKYQLFPYIYSYAREAYDLGLPIMRALFLEYPDDRQVDNLDSEFLFGNELLVAPVVEKGAAFKKVYLPEGEWFDYNDPQNLFLGNQWISYPVNLATIPIFVKKGSIIPQMPVMQYIGEKPKYPLLINIFAAGINKNASFDVYEDDGETNNYKRDVFIKRKILCKTNRKSINIDYAETISNGFVPRQRDLIYKIYMEEKPLSVSLSGKRLKTFRMRKNDSYEDMFIKDFKRAEWAWCKKSDFCIIRIPRELRDGKIIIDY